MRDINVKGGSNVFHITPPTQKELQLESISEPITIKVRPKEKVYLQRLAEKRGKNLSPMLRHIIFHYLKIETHLTKIHAVLDDIFG